MSKLKKSLQEQSFTNHSELTHDSPEIKSFIYQQINEFNAYVTPETTILVIARDPQMENEKLNPEDDVASLDYKHRIAIVLKEAETTIEAEAYHDDLFEAIRMAKTSLIDRLVQIQSEMEEHLIEPGSNNPIKKEHLH